MVLKPLPLRRALCSALVLILAALAAPTAARAEDGYALWLRYAPIDSAPLRAAYRLMFAEEGTFQERIDDVARVFPKSAEVMEIVDFIRADANRPLCLPTRDV